MPEPTAASRHLTTLLVLAYLGFISLGLPDAVLGVAWPSLRAAFSLPQAALGAPLAALAVSYFLSGLAAGSLMRRVALLHETLVATVDRPGPPRSSLR